LPSFHSTCNHPRFWVGVYSILFAVRTLVPTPPFQSRTRRKATRLMVDRLVPTKPMPPACTTESINGGYLQTPMSYVILGSEQNKPASQSMGSFFECMIDKGPTHFTNLLPPSLITFIAGNDNMLNVGIFRVIEFSLQQTPHLLDSICVGTEGRTSTTFNAGFAGFQPDIIRLGSTNRDI
jgi:hypothetical protein